MAVQTREEINRMRRLNRANKALRIRTLGIIKDRTLGRMSYPALAQKYGVSVGCVQKVLKCYQ